MRVVRVSANMACELARRHQRRRQQHRRRRTSNRRIITFTIVSVQWYKVFHHFFVGDILKTELEARAFV